MVCACMHVQAVGRALPAPIPENGGQDAGAVRNDDEEEYMVRFQHYNLAWAHADCNPSAVGASREHTTASGLLSLETCIQGSKN